MVDRCPRCRALGVEVDLRFDGAGRAVRVEHEAKLAQELERHEAVERASMVFHPAVGTDLQAMVGSKGGVSVVNAARISLQVRAALAQLQALQRAQVSYQEVSPREFLASVESVTTVRDPLEPTMYRVDVRASALSGRQVGARVLVEVGTRGAQ